MMPGAGRNVDASILKGCLRWQPKPRGSLGRRDDGFKSSARVGGKSVQYRTVRVRLAGRNDAKAEKYGVNRSIDPGLARSADSKPRTKVTKKEDG